MNEPPLCSHCHLQLFPEEWFLCIQCRVELDEDRAATFAEVCGAALTGKFAVQVEPLWRIG